MPITSAPQTPRWTREEYHDLAEAGFLNKDDHVELIDGEIIHMSLQNTPHAVSVRLVRRVLRRVFPADEYMVDEQLPLAFDPDSEPEPDVSVAEEHPRDLLDNHPIEAILVVEVADASLQFDRGKKRALYARHGLLEYWIVNLVERQLDVLREPEDESYADTTVYVDETVPLPGHSLSVADLLP